jgi:hypothetical protein
VPQVPDEAVAMLDKKRVQRWDRKKKKFVQTTVGEMRRGEQKTRTESGKVLVMSAKRKAEQQGKAYAKWSFKNKQSIGQSENAGGTDGSESFGTFGDSVGGGALVVDGSKMDYRRGAKKARHMAQLQGVVHKTSSRNTVNADVGDELKTEDTMRKEAMMSKHASDMNKGRKHMKALGRQSRGKGGKKKKGNFGTKGKVKMIIRKK